MGIYDRGYYDGDAWKGDGYQGGGGYQTGGFGSGGSIKGTAVAFLITINVIIFLVDMFSPKVTYKVESKNLFGQTEVVEQKTNHQQLSVALALKHDMEKVGFKGPVESPFYFWQILTYGFAHASIGDTYGLFHILGNMVSLFFLGIHVERKYGRSEFFKFYLLSLLFAGAVWLLVQVLTDRAGMAVGASGAVAAVVILFVLNFPRQTVLLMGVVPMPAWVLGVMFIGVDILNSFSDGNRIAVEAHFAGAAFAAAYFYGKWNFSWLRFGWLENAMDRFKRKPKLKVHAPEKMDAELTQQADIILEKVHRLGEESLSRKERKILERYSRTVRSSRED